MKKFLTILLLVSLFAQVSGYHLVFSLRQMQVKASSKRILRRSLTVEHAEVLEFSFDEWDQLPKEEDEFLHNNELYDIIHIGIKNQRVLVTCVCDGPENKLLRDYNALVKNDFGHKKAKKNIPLKLVIKPFIKPERLFFLPFVYDKTGYDPFTQQHLSTVSAEVITPPPQRLAA